MKQENEGSTLNMDLQDSVFTPEQEQRIRELIQEEMEKGTLGNWGHHLSPTGNDNEIEETEEIEEIEETDKE